MQSRKFELDQHTKGTRALVLSSKELDRLESHSKWLARQSEDGVERKKQIDNMKTASQNIVKKWNNTVMNKQRERLERRLDRLKREEDRKNAVYQASLTEAAENRKKTLDDARRLILFDRDDIHQINSAFVFSEVLRERKKQVEFKTHLKGVEAKERQEFAERIKLDVEAHKEQEAQRIRKDHEAKMERKAMNIKMITEKAENESLLLLSEKEQEKQDLIEMEKELKQVKENLDREVQRKKEHVKKDALESIAAKTEKERVIKQEKEDEEKVIEIYCKVKQRMDCMRQKMESEAREAKLEKQERIRAIITLSLKEKEDDIDSMIDKALKERDAREAEKLSKRKAYEAKLLKERKDYMTDVQNQKAQEERERKEKQKWVLMQRLKRDEVDRITKLKKRESQWATKMAVRVGYNEQLEQQREKDRRDCQEENKLHNYLLQKDIQEDNDFFKYAKEVIEECKMTDRPLFPIQRAINDYRKKHGIIQKEKYEKWVRENSEMKQFTKPDGDSCQELELLSPEPDVSSSCFNPFMKKYVC